MKNTSKTPTKKLSLHKQTLRQLVRHDDLTQVAGGMINLSRLTCECETSANTRCETFGTAVCP